MNRIDAQQAGGFPLETDTLDFLQKSFTALQSLIALGGDNYILSGCVVNGANVTDGFIVTSGELLPFKGGLLQTKVVVRQTETTRNFESGANKVVFYDRYAQFGTGDTFILFSDFVRIKDLKTFRNLPDQASSATDSDAVDTLATSKAVNDLYVLLKNQVPVGAVIIWSGAINAIPGGWALCDGLDGRPDLRDRFVLGAGNMYPVNALGGETDHRLTVDEVPALSVSGWMLQGSSDWRSGGDNSNDNRTSKYGKVNTSGGGGIHNNMPPYFALAYIIKL